MRKIRTFLVDDTAAIRRILIQLLEEDPEIEVVGTAADGAEGLRRYAMVEPDIIILDVEMPGMGGLEMLRELRKSHPDLPVLVFSSLTERGAMVTIDALSLGASDYVTKPAMVGSAGAAREHIKATLFPKIHSLGRRERRPSDGSPAPILAPKPQGKPQAGSLLNNMPLGRVDAVVIGVSTGGPNALSELIPALPATIPVPVLVVQHMPALFTKALAQRLDARSAIDVAECDAPVRVRPGAAWLAAGGYHMRLQRDEDIVWAKPDLSDPVNFCRPSVDILFQSAAKVYGSRVLGIILTGMGHDGLEGSRAIREAGGQVIIQDEASSVVWGMAGYVHEAGYANRVLPLQDIPAEIAERLLVGRPSHAESSLAQGAAQAP